MVFYWSFSLDRMVCNFGAGFTKALLFLKSDISRPPSSNSPSS